MKKQPLAKLACAFGITLLILWLMWHAAASAKSPTTSGLEHRQNVSTIAGTNTSPDAENGTYTLLLSAAPNNFSVVPRNDWSSSGHADATSESFTHWDDNNPPEIPTSCAKCHSTPGFWDFLGEDGSTPGTVDKPAPTGTVIECNACHNEAAEAMTDVSFASGSTISNLGRESVCLQCHQARNSTVSVDEMVDGYADDDRNGPFFFQNPHYMTAADTLYGNEAMGAYQYQGKTYLGRYFHVEEMNTCITCHEEHSLDIAVASCSECHSEVTSVADFVNIRTSTGDFDGDGTVTEGIAGEMATMHEALYQGIKDYAKNTLGAPIVYYAYRYPYFFNDTNGNGEADPDEVDSGNSFTEWTPRILKATYNYNYVAKERGAYSHNGHYILQILYDSVQNIGGDVSTMIRPS